MAMHTQSSTDAASTTAVCAIEAASEAPVLLLLGVGKGCQHVGQGGEG